MAFFDEPDAAADEGDASMWFASHTMKTPPATDDVASPVDVVADFDAHQAFGTAAATTIKMEIEDFAIDDAVDIKQPFDDDTFSLGLMQLEAAVPPSPSQSHSVSSPEPSTTNLNIEMTDLERRKQLSIERRRKRNREAMQRSRQRDKDYMDGLRDKAAELEKIHNGLVEQMNQKLSLTSTEPHLAELQAQLEDARQQAQSLMEQNLKFQDEITERIKGEDRMEGLLKEMIKDQERTAGTLSAILYDHMTPRVTMEKAMDIIMMARKKRQCIQKKRFATPGYIYNFFGWNIRNHFLGKYLFVSFRKMFRNRTAEEIATRTWSHVRQQVNYRTGCNRRKIVQELNEDTFVSAVDKRHPENEFEFIRIYNLRFRVRETDGVICIGQQTLPDIPFPDRALENVWASDTSMSILFTPIQECDLATREIVEHCHVEFVGKTRFGAHQLAQQNALETVISLSRWEETNVGTTQRLVWSES